MEEIMNNEINTIEEVQTDELYAATEESNDGVLGKVLIGLGVIAVVGVAAWVHKNKDKLEAKRIAKLEKKGYVITRPEPIDVDFTVADDDQDKPVKNEEE